MDRTPVAEEREREQYHPAFAVKAGEGEDRPEKSMGE
jgi:hypothetical protein